MKNSIILMLFLCQMISASSSIDSLKSCLKVATDSQKVDIYQELAVLVSADSLEQSIIYLKKAYICAVSIKNELFQANSLYNIALKYLDKSLLKMSSEYFEKAVFLYERNKSYEKAALCYAYIGSNFYFQYDFIEAIKFFKSSLAVCQMSKNLAYIEANCLESIGSINYLIGNIELSLIYHKKALVIHWNNDDSLNIANIYYLLGADYGAMCFYDKSIEYLLKSLEIYEKIGFDPGIALINHGISLLYLDFGLKDKSLELNLKSLELISKNGEDQLVTSIYKWLGSIYSQKQNWQQSFEYLNKAFKNEIKNKDKLGLIITLEKIGTLHYDQQRYQNALNYYNQSLEHLNSVDDKWRKAKLLISIGKVYLQQEKYIKALKLIKRGIVIAQKVKIKDLVLDGYKFAAESYEKLRFYKNAFKYQMLYMNLRDSIYFENSFKIADMQLRYETTKREKVNEILQKENQVQKEIIYKHEIQKWLLYGSVIFITSLAVIGYLKFISKNIYGIKLYKKINKAIEIQKEQEQSLIHKSILTKLGELATYIIHDLKQPLQDIKLSAEEIETGISENSIDQMLLKNSLNDIFEDVERISSMAEYVINSTNKKLYEKEIEFDINKSIANAYRMIRKHLSKQNIVLRMNLDKNLPPVLGNPWKFEHGLLNIISNSCHALSDVRKFRKEKFKEDFYIETFSNEYNVYVRVKDNGIGVINSFKSLMFYPFSSSKKPEEGSGLGLSIVYNVVRQMKGRLDFVSTPFVGTIITLVFPSASHRINNQGRESAILEKIKNTSIR